MEPILSPLRIEGKCLPCLEIIVVSGHTQTGLMIVIVFRFWFRVRDDYKLERLGRDRQR